MKLHIDESAIKNDSLVELLDVAAHFAAQRLRIPPRTRVILTITEFVRDREQWGECECFTPRLYLVKLHPSCLKEIKKLDGYALMCFFHEFVHVMQFSTGKLYETKGGKMIYKGRNITGIKYNDDPSEKEAFKKGYKLAELFANGFSEAHENVYG